MAQLMNIRLSRHDAQPWGFRLQGGKDFGTPLVVQKVNGGSIADQAGLIPGDAVLKVNNIDVFSLRHKDAQDIVVRSGNSFDITIQRGGSTWRPHVVPTGSMPSPSSYIPNNVPTVTRTSLAHKQQEVQHIGSGYNNAARPFNSVNGNDGQVKSIVNKQYNTPVGIYSEEAIAETLSAQAEVLAGGVLGVNFKKNEKIYNAANSEVLKMLHEQESEQPEPVSHAPANFFWTASHAIGRPKESFPPPQQQQQHHEDECIGTSLQQNTLAPAAPHRPSLPTKLAPAHIAAEEEMQPMPSYQPMQPPMPPYQPVAPSHQEQPVHSAKPSQHPLCDTCGVSIIGVFVRIKDKNLHAECFKCATCGTSLKNQGYFNFNNKLYCDIHARLAAMNNPPKGTEGHTPVPIKPTQTLSANTISAALEQHSQYNGSSNINSGYGGPKPFNNSPLSPQLSGPRSPSTYPPPTNQQSWGQPKPATNPYATLPRAGGQSQEESLQQCYEYDKQERHFQQRSVFEDMEVAEMNQLSTTHFNWPPRQEEGHCTPTASPLYIAPPETQHIVPKPIQKVRQEVCDVSQSQPQQWQSRSAPELTISGRQQIELESSSDSYTSTSTTTTTTSDEYQRMYQAHVQAYQMQQMYDQSGSEMDYHMDVEVASMQQQQEQSYSASTDYLSMQSGRRSALECAETISGPVSTYRLIDLIREVTPKPETPPPKPHRKVEFSDDVQVKEEKKKEVKAIAVKNEVVIKEESKDELRIERVSNEKLANDRKFTATPEIKFEIPEPKLVPPSNIPNPVPKEWISPMVKALTTAPDKPITISEPLPEVKVFESVHLKEEKAEIREETVGVERKEPEILQEPPAKGSFITNVMSTAPTDSIKFAGNINDPVPFPEETEPYMPPPIDMSPYEKEDLRPKSPMLKALMTAPERSYTPFGHDVCSQLNDLPTPKEKLTMVDALTVAPHRCYTPLNPENAQSKLENEQKQKKSAYELLIATEDQSQQTEVTEKKSQSLDVEMNQQLSAFANLKGYSKVSPFQPKRDSLTGATSNTIAEVSARHDSLLSSTQQNTQSFTSHRDSLLSNTQRTTLTQSSSQQQQQSTFQSSTVKSVNAQQSSSYHSMSQTQGCQSVCTAIQQSSCSQSECNRKSQETEQKISFPPPCGPMAKKTLLSGLHKPDNIPQYQRNWTVLPSQRPVKTPEPPELRENVPLAFVDTPHELTPNAPSPYYDQQATSTASSNIDSAAYNATIVSESKTTSVPIFVTENTGPVTMAFQSLDLHDDYSQLHPRPFTPSLINKPAPIVPSYQQPERLITEECSAKTSHLFDPRSVSPLPDRSRSPAPGPPPNPLNAIRAPRINQEDYRPTQAGSITTGQSYYGTQAAQYQQQQQGQLVSHYETSAQSGAQAFIDKPEVVQQRQIGDMTVQTRAKESQLNEAQQSQLQSKTTTQVGNMQIERRRKVVEEYEHTQSAKSVEILKTSGETRQIGKTGFVANQARRLSGLEQEISSITDQSQAISARASNLAPLDTTFPHFKSPEPVTTFPIKPVLPPHSEPQRPSYVFPPDTSNTLVDAPPGFKGMQTNAQQQANFMASSTSTYAASSAQSTAAVQNSLTSASKLNTAIPVPAFKPPMQFGDGVPSLSNKVNHPPSQQLTNAYKPSPSNGPAGFKPPPPLPSNIIPSVVNDPSPASAGPNKGGVFGATSAPKRGRGILNKAVGPGARVPLCGCCNSQIRGPFITALGRIWCPDHFVCVNGNCRRPLQDIGFVEEKGDLYCEYCFEKYLAPTCSKCSSKIKGDCLNAIGKHYHPECFTCSYCGKLFGNSPFFLEEGEPYCEADWNELFTTKCFACGFPVEAGDRWVEALNHNYHSQCFNCTMCKKNLEGQSFYNKGGRPFCKNHAR